jgi:hypothetical protein
MTNVEKCIAWFHSKGISAWSEKTFDGEFVYIRVLSYEVHIDNEEIEHRSELYNMSQP